MAQRPVAQRQSTYQANTWFPGPSFSTSTIPSDVECQRLCTERPDCCAWTFNTSNNECQLKNLYEPAQHSLFMVSGFVTTPGAAASNTHMRADAYNTRGGNTGQHPVYALTPDHSEVYNTPAPITRGRFNNNRAPDVSTIEPFYASGDCADAPSSARTISRARTTPYNGTSVHRPNLTSVRRPNHSAPRPNLREGFAPSDRTSTIMEQTNCPSDNSINLMTGNMTDCEYLCLQNEDCGLWSFDNGRNSCSLKNGSETCTPNSNFTSGRIVQTASAPSPVPTYTPAPIYVPPAPAPAPIYVPSAPPLPPSYVPVTYAPLAPVAIPPSPTYTPLAPVAIPSPTYAPLAPSTCPPSTIPVPSRPDRSRPGRYTPTSYPTAPPGFWQNRPPPVPSSYPSSYPSQPQQQPPITIPQVTLPQNLQLPTKVNAPVRHMSFRPTEDTRFVYVADAETCKNTCMNQPNCSQWSFNTINGRPTCSLDNRPPQVMYQNWDADGGRVYSVQSYPQEFVTGRPQEGFRR